MEDSASSRRIEGVRPVVTRRRVLGSAALLASPSLAGCSERLGGDGSDPNGRSPDGGSGPESTSVRLASHEFVPVGEARELGDIGEILEIIEFDGQVDLSDDETEYTCLESGVACIRARYRNDDFQNNVQTKCVIGIDETGPCDGREPASFDLQQYADRPGDSNLLASGDGRFYRVCDAGRGFRLERSDRELPPLYFQIVDATTDGAYAISPDEYDQQRRGTIRTYSGDVIQPPWIVFLGGVAGGRGTVTTDGVVEIEFADCAESPECTDDPSFVHEGDIVEMTQARIGDLAGFRDAHGEPEATDRLNALLDRGGVAAFEWEDIDARLGQYVTSEFEEQILELDFKGALFERLVRLQTFERTVEHFDTVHSLREKGVTVTLFDDLLNVPLKCPSPDEAAVAVCHEFETVVADAEDRMLASLRSEFPLWVHVSHWEEPSRHRPRIENFDGVLVRAGFSDQSPIEAQLESIPRNVRSWLSHLSTLDLDIVLVGEGPVSLYESPGVLCEAEFCPSDFGATFRLNESLLDGLLSDAPDHAAGFGVPTFEGAHFDIRHPVEDRSGYELNRVGETGYNNPTLNIYATR